MIDFKAYYLFISNKHSLASPSQFDLLYIKMDRVIGHAIIDGQLCCKMINTKEYIFEQSVDNCIYSLDTLFIAFCEMYRQFGFGVTYSVSLHGSECVFLTWEQ